MLPSIGSSQTAPRRPQHGYALVVRVDHLLADPDDDVQRGDNAHSPAQRNQPEPQPVQRIEHHGGERRIDERHGFVVSGIKIGRVIQRARPVQRTTEHEGM
jgi:hypothetical protein